MIDHHAKRKGKNGKNVGILASQRVESDMDDVRSGLVCERTPGGVAAFMFPSCLLSCTNQIGRKDGGARMPSKM